MRRAVEADDGDAMIDVPMTVEDCVEMAIVTEMACSGSAGFDHDGEGERLEIAVGIEDQMLAVRRRVSWKSEAVSSKTFFPSFVFTMTGTSTRLEWTVRISWPVLVWPAGV